MLLKDEWLSNYFKDGAYVYCKSDSQTYLTVQKGFISTKIPLEDISEITSLIKDGFNLVEISAFFEQKKTIQYLPRPQVHIDFVKPHEKDDVIEIAKNAFLNSRFFQDKHIPRALAQQIKSDWVANYFSGKRGDNMIVARIHKRVIGFLLLVNQTIIDLIAVSSYESRQGIATSMIGFANQTIGLLSAGTQLNNQASIALYEKSGFFLKHTQFVLHKFIE